MNSYLTIYRACKAERGDILLASVYKVGASIQWARKHANEIARRIARSNDQLPPICAMWVSEAPPAGMESAA